MSVEFLTRWLHVVTAAVLLGGAVFHWWALLPGIRPLSDDLHTQVRERVAARWRLIVMLGIAVLLVTGFYNYIVIAIPRQKGVGLYHALMGTKILLALAAFFLGSVLSGRSAKFAQMRRNAGMWLLVLIAMLAAIVGLGSALKVGLVTKAVTPSGMITPPPAAGASSGGG